MDNPKKEEAKKENKFEWADEGVSTLVRVVILGWSAAILTLNYVTVPGIPQKILIQLLLPVSLLEL